MPRASDKHIDSEELSLLAPWSTNDATEDLRSDSVEQLRDLHFHLATCADCRKKLLEYRQIVASLSNPASPASAAAGPSCPSDVDWQDVVTGSWPEMKIRQLISHAALCDHCGPMLRAATRDAGNKRSQELVPAGIPARFAKPPARRWQLLAWLIPVCSAVVVLGVLFGGPLFSSTLSGTKYAEFAARMHVRHAQGGLKLDVRSDSQQAVNDWLLKNADFPLTLPSSETSEDPRPYRLEGAALVRVGDKRAAFIAYQMDSGPASLMIAPYAVSVASGGVEAHFKKVTFHYRTVDGLKVVTWSQHGLTYALVSHEGTTTQKSCMVCHSAMRDRDLTNTPTPPNIEKNNLRHFLQ